MIKLEDKITIQSPKTNSKMQKLSDKYQFLNTVDISNIFYNKNWNLIKEYEAKVTTREHIKGFQKHMLIFENDEFITNEGNIQLVIRNSHEGSSALELFYGFMRIKCANQLFVKNLGKGESHKILHRGSDELITERLNRVLIDTIEGISKFKENINFLDSYKMNDNQKIEFAESVLNLRYGKEKSKSFIESNPYLFLDILRPIRDEDKGNEAWKILNIVQEKFVKGDIIHFRQNNGRKNVIRGVNSIYVAPDFNQKVWETMINIVQNDN